MKFALSFLVVGDPAVVSAVLELKGEGKSLSSLYT